MEIKNTRLETLIETKIKPNLKTIYNMRIKGFKDRHITQVLGISVPQFYEVMNNYDDLKDIYNDATMYLCSELRSVVIDRALGTDGKTDKDGNLIGPDANLAMRLLERLDPQFAQKEEKVVTVTIEQIVHELNEKRRIEEAERSAIEDKNNKRGVTIDATEI